MKWLIIVGMVIIFGCFSTSSVWAKVIINEIYPNPEVADMEWVEIYNNGEETVSLNNWYLSDEKNHKKFLTELVEITAKGFKIHREKEGWLNNSTASGGTPDTVFLFNDLNELQDSYTYGDSSNEKIVWGRYPDGGEIWDQLELATPEATNSGPVPTPTGTPTSTLSPTPTTPQPTNIPTPGVTKVPTPTPTSKPKLTPTPVSTLASETGQRSPSPIVKETPPETDDDVTEDNGNLTQLRQGILGQQTVNDGGGEASAQASVTTKKVDPLALGLIGGGGVLLTLAGVPLVKNLFRKDS